MKADDLNDLIVGLKIMKSHINILIDSLVDEPKKDENKTLLRNITLDLRELYESYYLHNKDKK